MNVETRYQPPAAAVADAPLQEPDVGPLNPWFSMWLQPRATIQQIVESDPNRLIIAMSMLIGVVQALDRASSRSVGDRLSLGAILAIALLLGPLMGVITIHVYAWLVRWTGRVLGGRAAFHNIRAALVWGNVPGLWVSLTWIPALLILQKDMFTTETPLADSSIAHMAVLLGVGVAHIVGGVWTIVAVCKALGQVQDFSAWKALANAILAGLTIVAPVVIIAVAATNLS